jgi:hypothetical protein
MDSKPEQGRNETNIQSDDGALANPPSSASNVIPQATIVSDFPAEKGAQGNEFCATGVYPGPAPVYPPPTSVATPSPHLQAADGVVDRLLHLVDELHDRKENRRYDRDLRHEELRERLRIEREQRHNVPASQGYLGIAPGYPMTAPGYPMTAPGYYPSTTPGYAATAPGGYPAPTAPGGYPATAAPGYYPGPTAPGYPTAAPGYPGTAPGSYPAAAPGYYYPAPAPGYYPATTPTGAGPVAPTTVGVPANNTCANPVTPTGGAAAGDPKAPVVS